MVDKLVKFLKRQEKKNGTGDPGADGENSQQ